MPQRVNGGQVLVAIGAVVLLVSLFLDWYSPSVNAWKAFELVDLLLAAIAVAALVETAAGVLERPGAPARFSIHLLPASAVAAAVLVAASLINHPPAAIDRSLEAGAWIGLIGALLLAAGAALTAARVSLVITLGSDGRSRPAPAPSPAADPFPPAGPDAPRAPSASVHDEPTKRVGGVGQAGTEDETARHDAPVEPAPGPPQPPPRRPRG